MFTIARPIEGITLNGLEYLLDDATGEPRVFATVELAVMYLQATEFGHMTTEEILELFTIEPVPNDTQFEILH